MDDEEDERIQAWYRIAKHPFFAEAYAVEVPLIDAMWQSLDEVMAQPAATATVADEPVEWRVLRAFTNGYSEGLRRGHEGRLDR